MVYGVSCGVVKSVDDSSGSGGVVGVSADGEAVDASGFE